MGEGPDETALEALRRDLELESCVTLAGPLNRDDVQREIDACDLFILTSVTAADGDEEGIPVVLMEAMASGAPVISTRHSGIPELVRDAETGLLTDEGDAGAVADAVERLASDPALARALAASARRHVEDEFNLALTATRFGAHISRIIADHDRASSQAPAPGGARRMLFIRSVPVPVALSKLVVLRHRYPDAEFTVLTRSDSRVVFETCPLVTRVHTFPDGRVAAGSLPPSTVAQLRSVAFERIFVPVGSDEQGYDNVVQAARLCGDGAVVRLHPDNVETEVLRRGVE